MITHISRYQVEVTQEGGWLMIRVPEIDGLTQARRLIDVEEAARELIAVTLGMAIPLAEIAVRVTRG